METITLYNTIGNVQKMFYYKQMFRKCSEKFHAQQRIQAILCT